MIGVSPTDAEIAIGTAIAVCLIFMLAFWAQGRRVRLLPVADPLPVAMPGLGGSVDRFTQFETKFDAKIGAIEERQKANETRQTANETKMGTIDHDVKGIRMALQALPSKDAVHRLEVDVTKLAGRVETVDSTVIATQRSVDRIESFLLSGGKT